MKVELSLFGFGDDRPRSFGTSDHLTLTLPESTAVAAALSKAGFSALESVTAVLNSKVVPPQDWDTTPMTDGDALKVLLAIEGG